MKYCNSEGIMGKKI